MAPTLPTNVQYAIAQHLVADFRDLNSRRSESRETAREFEVALSTLLSLRLTCKHLSDAEIIKSAIFEEIVFQSTKDSVRRVHNTRQLALIAPFVHKVTFLPSPFFVEISLLDFRKLLERLHHYKLPQHCKRHIRMFWGGSVPTTDDGVQKAYTEHQRRGMRDANLLRSGELSCFWAITLPQFPRAAHFHLSSLMGRHPLHPCYDGCGKSCCTDCEDSALLLRNKSLLADDWLPMVAVQSLVSSGVLIQTFPVDSELAHTLGICVWNSLSWSNLNLSQAQRFELTSPGFSDSLLSPEPAIRSSLASRSLLYIFLKFLDNIEEVSINVRVDLPTLTLPFNRIYHSSFPRLVSMQIGGCLISLPWLVSLMAESPKLRTLHLRYCSPMGPKQPGGLGWKMLFDAIRYHPKPLRVNLDEICLDDWDWFSIDMDYGGATFDHDSKKLSWNWCKTEFALYLANRGPWTDTMELHWVTDWNNHQQN